MMNQADYGILSTIVGMSEQELLKMLTLFLRKTYGKKNVSATKTYIVAEGKIPIALVAHLDTVFKSPPNEIYYDQKKEVVWSPQGLGADDRAGVFIIMKLLQEGLRPHVIFTTGEEIGGVGASILTKVFPKPPFNVKYLVELDRQGISDCVFYDCDNPSFEEYINSFGYVTAWGTFSDISEICPVWKIAGVNLSVGYIREHSVSETLFLKGTYSTIERVRKMLAAAGEAQTFDYIPDVHSYFYNYPYYYSSFAANWDEGPQDDPPMDARSEHKMRCWKCNKEYEINDFIPVASKEDALYDHAYCFNCISDDSIGWCIQCGDAFEKKFPNQTVCGICNNGVKEKLKAL